MFILFIDVIGSKCHLSELCTEFTAEKRSKYRQKKVQFYNLIDRDEFLTAVRFAFAVLKI